MISESFVLTRTENAKYLFLGLLFVHLVKQNCTTPGFIASDLLVTANQKCNGKPHYPDDIIDDAEINGNETYPADERLDLNKGERNLWNATVEWVRFDP